MNETTYPLKLKVLEVGPADSPECVIAEQSYRIRLARNGGERFTMFHLIGYSRQLAFFSVLLVLVRNPQCPVTKIGTYEYQPHLEAQAGAVSPKKNIGWDSHGLFLGPR